MRCTSIVLEVCSIILYSCAGLYSLVKGENYCIGSCSDPRNLLYEGVCCEPENVNNVVRITVNNRQKYISCPSTLPDSCHQGIGIFEASNATSCKDIVSADPSAASGYYEIYDSNNVERVVYCKMDGCDGEGGWMRIAYLNMTEPNSTCPSGMTTLSFDNIDHDLCGRHPSAGGNCDSVFFSVDGYNYSKVCGQMRGYQYHSPDGFQGYLNGKGIEENYVCGYSITYGNEPRNHIWTYAGGIHQNRIISYDCPCNTGYPYNAIPPFVNDSYYCESGLPLDQSFTGVLYINDTLWDGKDCLALESTCCTDPNMPWFYKELHGNTSDDIEVRACSLYGTFDEDVPIDVLELYVK